MAWMKALRILAKNILDVSMYVTVRSISHFSSFVMAWTLHAYTAQSSRDGRG